MKNEGANRDIIEETYEEIEEELLQKIEGLEKQIEIIVEKRNTTIEVNRIAKTALDIFRDILEKPTLDKGDLSLILDRIIVHGGEQPGIDIELKADIKMLLEAGTLTDEQLQEAGYRGMVVNFNWDIESNLKATIVQKAQNQRDKAFGVNVICGGDPLEIYTDSNGEVIFKKYSPIGELGPYTKQYAEILGRTTALPVVICDRDHIIAVSGIPKKEALDKRISPFMENYMESRRNFVRAQGEGSFCVADGLEPYVSVMSPIIGSGDVLGAVVLLSDDRGSAPTQTNIKLVQVAASFLGKQMEE
ncbi:MAG: stage V sporulation T C-terminal domain-containing protein, partial [Acutalibacteraceae bacterium]